MTQWCHTDGGNLPQLFLRFYLNIVHFLQINLNCKYVIEIFRFQLSYLSFVHIEVILTWVVDSSTPEVRVEPLEGGDDLPDDVRLVGVVGVDEPTVGVHGEIR